MVQLGLVQSGAIIISRMPQSSHVHFRREQPPLCNTPILVAVLLVNGEMRQVSTEVPLAPACVATNC